ncbi:MAG: GNAT family N-acetyltransferase [Deltaproteobacteria bacterium]|nr:GNAT family N-acetyltransferase [Deltaproteobacteria bacterium]
MSDLRLRPLHPDDLDRVSEIESRIAGHPRKVFLEKRFAAATAAPDSFITCAAVDGEKLAGYGFARLQEGEFGTRGVVAVLDVIGVDPDAQGKGIGKAVIAEIERQMKKKNIGTLRTQVAWANHRMIRFFSSAGFNLAPCQIIERDTSPLGEDVAEVTSVKMDGKWQVHSGAGGNYYESLARHQVLVRSLKEEDLAAVVRIDGKLTGLDRSAYYGAKFREMLIESGIRVSLAAEDEGIVTGFVMARVDFGEFGKVDRAAVIDTIGVHPAYGGSGIGHALLSRLLLNLSILQVETVLAQVSRETFTLQRFLHARGFVPSQRLVLTKAVG